MNFSLIWLFVVFEIVHTTCYMHKFIGSMIFNGLMLFWRNLLFWVGIDLIDSFENWEIKISVTSVKNEAEISHQKSVQ